MQEKLIGLVLAVALLGGLFFAANHRADRAPVAGGINVAAIRAAAETVKPGFVGLKQIGAWEVACAAKPVMVDAGTQPSQKPAPMAGSPPLPLTLGATATAGAAASPPAETPAAGSPATPSPVAEKVSLGRCRVSQAFRRKGASKKEVALAVNFRFVGAAQGRLGLFVRLPKGKKGETVALRFGKAGLKLPIVSCGEAGCMAIAVLAQESARQLASADGAELVLPPGPGGKLAAVRLAFVGLPAALGAIRRAQS